MANFLASLLQRVIRVRIEGAITQKTYKSFHLEPIKSFKE
jgi:hypothetical protein